MARAAKKKGFGLEDHSEGDGMERWLLTYSDLITLLLALFMTMLAISRLKEGEMRRQSEENKKTPAANMKVDVFGQQVLEEITRLRKVKKEIDSIVERKGLTEKIKLLMTTSGLVLRFQENIIFEIGSDDLKEQARSALDMMAPIMRKFPNVIRVEGHTDNVPISTAQFRSNFHLSSARAISVIFYMVKKHGFSPECIYT
jgi:chemotaxis protein MotB